MSLAGMIEDMAKDAKAASRRLRRVGRAQKDSTLELLADKLIDMQADIIKENGKDLTQARKAGLSAAMIDRLAMDYNVIRGMADGLREVAALPDPVGEVLRNAETAQWTACGTRPDTPRCYWIHL